MSDITTLMMAAAGGVAEETDENFNQTVLLLHGDGTNGAQNNTFIDSGTANSGSGFTITRNPTSGPNAPTQGTFSPFSAPDGRWSNYFNGTGDWVEFGSSADFAVGSVVTLECWFYPLAQAGALMMGTVGTAAPQLGWQNSTTFGVASVGVAWRLTSATIPTLNAWNHVAFVRTGTGSNEASIFLNGTRIANGTVSDAWTSNTGFTVGAASDDSAEFTGYISNARVVKGTAVYSPSSTTITVPTSPFSTSTTNQKLLTCYSNRFVDANTATTAKAITVNGNPKVTPFSPFAPTAAYSASVNGGSGYFDGTGDYLTAGSASDWTFLHNGSDWTCEFWLYHTTTDVDAIISTTAFTAEVGMSIFINPTYGSGVVNGVQVYITRGVSGSEAVFNSTGLLKPNQWNYVAITFTSSTKTCAFTINGASAGSTANTGFAYSASAPTNTLAIGRYQGSTPAGNLSGYIGSLRISSNIRTGLTSIPTAPYTSDSDTKLLTNFTNAGIFDNTGKNNLETVGNAQIDTTTKKFGTGALEFDGTGDYLLLGASNPNLLLGTGPFTIEFWFNTTSSTRYAQFIGNEVGTTGDIGFTLLINNASSTAGDIVIYRAGTAINSATGTSYRDGNWHHLAFVRDSAGSRLYLNGTQQGTTTAAQASTSFDSATSLRMVVGANLQFTGRDYLGFIDDLRITKGVARYTSNFTVPDKAFPDL